MDDNQRDELLSAYLDGELEAADAARVEQWLEEDAECRATLEEMQTVRRALRALPRHALAAGFADGVIRRAERTVLSEAAAVTSRPSDARHRSASNFDRHGRRFLWPVLAVAAALLIAVNPVGLFSPPDDAEDQLAKEDGEPSVKTPGTADSKLVEVGVPKQFNQKPAAPSSDVARKELRQETDAGKGGGGFAPERDEPTVSSDGQVVANELVKNASSAYFARAKTTPAKPGTLADTIYVVCEISPNMSPREVVRLLKSRYETSAKGRKYRQTEDFAYRNATDFKSKRGRDADQRRSLATLSDDAKTDLLRRKLALPNSKSIAEASTAKLSQPQPTADDADTEQPKQQQFDGQEISTFVATMTDDQWQAVVDQLREQQGWNVTVGGELGDSAGQTVAQTPKDEERSSFSLNSLQGPALGAATRQRRGGTKKNIAPREKPLAKPRDAISPTRSKLGELGESAKSEAKTRLAKDGKSLRPAAPGDRSAAEPSGAVPAENRAFADRDINDQPDPLGGKPEAFGAALANSAPPSPARRVVFVFRVAPVPQAEATPPAK